MKKILLLFLFTICAVYYSHASNVGHFSKNVAEQNVSVGSLSDYFLEWFNLPESTIFILTQEKTDLLGIQHLNFQQFLNGIPVEGCRVFAHAKDGQVMYVNGVLLENHIVPTAPKRMMGKKHIQQISNSSSVDDCILTPIFVGDSVMYKYAYKSSSAEAGYDIYYDAETGEILKKISTRYDLTSAQGTASTFYEGTKSITCGFENNSYKLIDPERNIYTYNASNVPSSLLRYRVPSSVVDGVADYLSTSLPDEVLNDEQLYEFALRNGIMQEYIIPTAEQAISIPTSSTSSFTGAKVTKIVINSINTNSWQGLFESAPDLFITIEDQNGIERYSNKANRITSASLPATFTINVPMWADDYKLKIWDYDAIGNDLIASLLLDQEVGTFDHSGNVNAKVTQSKGAPSPILDAHWGMEQAYDFYLNVFNRNSFDGLGSPIYQFVNVPNDVIEDGNNAFASFARSEAAYMAYGMGDGSTKNPFVDLTIESHEYSHLITHFNSSDGLKYENESGALNEAFSDIFAICVENYVEGAPSWLIGHKGLCKDGKSNLRSLKNPYLCEDGAHPCPKAYLGRYWVPSTTNPNAGKNDYGGVHTNSSVLNYWFYVLCTGGTITNEFKFTFSVRGIGIEKAQILAYMLNQYYLTEYATYQDAYIGSLIIAELIYGYGSEEFQSVQNAWGVVGIGNGYQGNTYPLEEGKYLVMARRNVDSTYYKMEANVGTASTKRFQATNTFSNIIASETATEQPESFIWEVEKIGSSYAIKSGESYITWTSGNSANLSNNQSLFTITPQTDGSYRVSVPDGSATRYLSLNKTEGNNYFAFYSGTAQVPNLRFEKYLVKDLITVRAKMPSNWGSTIRAWVWTDGSEGEWVTPMQDDEWYVYYARGEYNIIFVNGTTWNGDNNQTIDISVTGNMCIQVDANTTGKRTYSSVDCETEPVVRDCMTLPYSETFASNQGDFTIENVALDGLGYVWTFASGYGMKASAYVSSVYHPTESWLISPCLEFPEESSITLTFDHVYRYTSTPTTDLTLLVSENYIDGAPSTATWTPVAIPTYSSGSNWTFVNAGNINLDAYAGKNVTLAFRYKSSSSAAATWEIKNVSITSSITTGVDNILNQNNATKCIIDGHLFILRDGHKYTTTGTMIE